MTTGTLHFLKCQDSNCNRMACVARREWEDREKGYRDALETIARWEFATDGRKFDGNHKAVLKEVVIIARQALE